MAKYIYDGKNGLWYELRGDYYLPCLRLPETTEVHIGIWGQHHRRYLKEHLKTAYTRLLTSGKLNSYLTDIDHQAEELFSQLVSQMADTCGFYPLVPLPGRQVRFASQAKISHAILAKKTFLIFAKCVHGHIRTIKSGKNFRRFYDAFLR